LQKAIVGASLEDVKKRREERPKCRAEGSEGTRREEA
jgi:hypothetical protein